MINLNRAAGFRLAMLALGLSGFMTGAPARALISVSSESPRQGQVVEVYVESQAAGAVAGDLPVSFNKHNYKTFPVSGDAEHKYRVLLPVPVQLPPGQYEVRAAGEKKVIAVLPGRFATQHLRLPPGKDTFAASPGEAEAVDKAKATVSSERFWQSKFSPPAAARVSATFGLKRVVNGRQLPDYFHSGIDYAAPLGAPVKACAPGKVILVGSKWKLHGNCLAIDHGQGVVSFYIHLQKTEVAQGDMVKAGQVIGRVGQTGRANGPHLHFSIYVNDEATNPSDWFKQLF